MSGKQGNNISETFMRGLDAISEDKRPRFSAKSKEIKNAVAESLS